MLSAQPDRPIAGPDEDRLGLQPFADGLATALLADDSRTARGVVLGLEGSWGSGKSSILNLVAARLAERAGERLVLVRFDPWLVSGRDDLIAAFIRELVDAIDPVRKERGRVGSAAAKLAEYGEMLSPALNLYVPLLGTAVGGLMKAAGKGVSPSRSPTDMRKDVEKVLAELDRPVVVLVDELDRVEDAEVRTVAQLVRAVLDFPNVSYVLAYDPKRVSEALGGGDEKRGAAYLEKIVQLRVPLPAQAPDALRRVIDADFRVLMAASPAADRPPEWDRLSPLLEAAVPALLATLRDVRRTLATFAALEPMLRHEVEPVDLLGWSMLVAKAPSFVRLLAEQLPTVCGHALETGEALLQAHLYDRHSLFLAENDLPSPDQPAVASVADLLLLRTSSEGDVAPQLPAQDLLVWRDTLLTTLTEGSHAPRCPIERALAAVGDGYPALIEAAKAAWADRTLPQLLLALRIAYWRERSHGPMELRGWIIRLAEDDVAFGPMAGTRRRHRWLAMGFLIVLQSQSHPFPDLDLRALLQAMYEGHTAVASHILVLFKRRSELPERRRQPLPMTAFGQEQIEQLAAAFADRARELAAKGALVRSLTDSTQADALRLTGALDTGLRACIWKELADDAALDHLVELFFGDEPEDDFPGRFGQLFEEAAAIRDRLLARAEAHGEAGPPEPLRRAIDAMETRARFLADANPPTEATETGDAS